jgi:hypothetical protein
MIMLFIKDMLALVRVTVRRLSILVILLAVVVVAVCFTARFEVVDWLVRRGLYETPTPIATYEVVEVRTDRIVLGGVAIDGLLWADRVEIGYSLRQVIDGRVGTILIRGAVLQVSLDSSGNPTGPASDWVAMLAQSEPSDRPPAFDNVVLEHGIVDVTAPWLHLRADVDGALRNCLIAVGGAGTWLASFSMGTAEGSFSLHAPHGEGSPEITIALDTGDLGYKEMVAQGLSGTVLIEAAGSPQVTAELQANSLRTRDHTIAPLALNATVDGGDVSGHLTLGNDQSAMSASFDVELDVATPNAPATVTAWLDAQEDFTLPGPYEIEILAPARLDMSLATAAGLQATGLTTEELIGALDITGAVTMHAEGLIAPGSASSGQVDLAFKLGMAMGEALMVLEGPGHISDIRYVGGDTSAPSLSAILGQTYDLNFDDRVLRFALGPTDEGWAVSPRITAHLIGSENLDGTISMGGTAALDTTWTLLRTSVSTFEVDLQGNIWPEFAEGSLRIAG